MNSFFRLLVLLFSISSYAATTYGQFSSMVTQVPGTKPSIVKLDKTDALKNMAISPGKDKIIIKEDGVYFLIAAGQSGAIKEPAKGIIDLWIIRNEQGLPNSTARISVRDAFDTAPLLTEVIAELNAGDTVSIGFSATDPNLGFIYSEPPNEPASVSFFISIFKMESI